LLKYAKDLFGLSILANFLNAFASCWCCSQLREKFERADDIQAVGAMSAAEDISSIEASSSTGTGTPAGDTDDYMTEDTLTADDTVATSAVRFE